MNRSLHEPLPRGWLVLIYRMPTEPSSSRVAIWRDLKRIGAHYLQQCVCIVPSRPELRETMDGVREKIVRLGGSSNLFEAPSPPADEEESLIEGFRELVAKQYAEIVEECDTKFVKEIEFENFRENYTFAEAEEIEQDLDKIRRWYDQVRQRDWFDAPGREDVEIRIAGCAELLEGFYAEVHARSSGHATGPDAQEIEHVIAQIAEVPPSRPKASRRTKGDTA